MGLEALVREEQRGEDEGGYFPVVVVVRVAAGVVLDGGRSLAREEVERDRRGKEEEGCLVGDAGLCWGEEMIVVNWFGGCLVRVRMRMNCERGCPWKKRKACQRVAANLGHLRGSLVGLMDDR